jgi:hypothetical protein
MTITGQPRTAGGPPTLECDRTGAGPRWRDWLTRHADGVRGLVGEHGAVRVVGLAIGGPGDLVDARTALGARPAYAREHFAPRRALGDGVYATPEWDPQREMCPHHEQSFAVDFPGLMLLGCVSAATGGGEVSLCDTRKLLAGLPADAVARFDRQGWRLVRTFHPFFGISWSDAYGVDDRPALERFCASRAISLRWEPGGAAHTCQHRPALVRHPVTGDRCWFNDLAFLSLWSVEPAEREVLRQAFGPDGVPLNTAYGDGTALDQATYRAVQSAYTRAAYRLRWSAGDLLVLDNLLMAYGRQAFTGPLEIIHALAEPRSHTLA